MFKRLTLLLSFLLCHCSTDASKSSSDSKPLESGDQIGQSERNPQFVPRLCSQEVESPKVEELCLDMKLVDELETGYIKWYEFKIRTSPNTIRYVYVANPLGEGEQDSELTNLEIISSDNQFLPVESITGKILDIPFKASRFKRIHRNQGVADFKQSIIDRTNPMHGRSENGDCEVEFQETDMALRVTIRWRSEQDIQTQETIAFAKDSAYPTSRYFDFVNYSFSIDDFMLEVIGENKLLLHRWGTYSMRADYYRYQIFNMEHEPLSPSCERRAT